jgi:hypothetical protein
MQAGELTGKLYFWMGRGLYLTKPLFRCALPVSRWALWVAESGDTAIPRLDFVEPLLRRRLSTLARMSLHVANECAADLPRLRFVYASRHGELKKTTTMLEDLAANEPLSPTVFSLAVLNATAGLFSILRKDTSPSTAISAAEASFGFGLLEAAAQFELDRSSPVLYVYADESMPSVYGDADKAPAHALAILLAEHEEFVLDCAFSPDDEDADDTEAQSLACVPALRDGTAARWRHGGRAWTWQRTVQ